MLRLALAVTAVLAGCAKSVGDPPADPVEADPRALPAGIYGGPPLARLPGGPVLWASGQRATGEGETQAAAVDADYRRVARAGGGLLACGLKETQSGYFSGLTGRRSCVIHPPRGPAREVLPRGRAGQRGFQDILARGSALAASSGDAIEVYDLRTGRRLGLVRTAGAPIAPGTPGATPRPRVLTGPAALLSTPQGVVHARLLNHGQGWRVWSQPVTWTDHAVSLGAPSTTVLPAELAGVGHDLRLVGGGLDGRRFLFGRRATTGFVVAELAGAPTEAVVRWSGAAPGFSDVDVKAAAENGLVGLGASGTREQAALVIDLTGRAPTAAPMPLDQPACAIPRSPGYPPHRTLRFISGPQGLEAVTEWPGRRARCWTARPVHLSDRST